MTQRVLLFVWILGLAGGFFPARPAHAQTLRTDTVTLQEVTVAAPKYSKHAAGSRIQQVDTLLLQRHPGSTLADLLQQRSPLYIKSNGNGMLATVAFRGTTASHTAVLWNGFNIALPTLGLSDFGLLPPSAHMQVRLQPGSSGALHGSGAVGGTVSLDNPVSFRDQQAITVQQELGSFGHYRSAAAASFSNDHFSSISSFTRTSSDNNFRFQNTTAFNKPWETQQNAAFQQHSAAQDLHYQLNKGQRVSLRGWYVKTHRQIQPSMGSANNHAVQHDENLRLMAEWQGQLARGMTTVRSAWFKDLLNYKNDGTFSLSTVHTYQAQLEHERQVLPHLLLQVGGEGQLFKARVGGYGGKVSEQRLSAYGWLRYDPLPQLQVSLNVRQAWVQGFNPPLTPTLGANFQLLATRLNTLLLKANLSRNYRVPTLNDRFWKPGGNPSLQPENGWGYEGGLQHLFKLKKLTGTTELTAYRLTVQDWIQWQPSAPSGAPAPVNLSQVLGHGFELDSRWQYQPTTDLKLQAGGSYAYAISEQKLPDANYQLQDRQLFYVPKHKVSVWTDLQYHRWWLTADATFTSLRYTDNDNNNWLPAYALINTSLGRTFAWHRFHAQLTGQVLNLTNTVYQTIAFQAMPPRNFRVSLSLKWAQHP